MLSQSLKNMWQRKDPFLYAVHDNEAMCRAIYYLNCAVAFQPLTPAQVFQHSICMKVQPDPLVCFPAPSINVLEHVSDEVFGARRAVSPPDLKKFREDGGYCPVAFRVLQEGKREPDTRTVFFGSLLKPLDACQMLAYYRQHVSFTSFAADIDLMAMVRTRRSVEIEKGEGLTLPLDEQPVVLLAHHEEAPSGKAPMRFALPQAGDIICNHWGMPYAAYMGVIGLPKKGGSDREFGAYPYFTFFHADNVDGGFSVSRRIGWGDPFPRGAVGHMIVYRQMDHALLHPTPDMKRSIYRVPRAESDRIPRVLM